MDWKFKLLLLFTGSFIVIFITVWMITETFREKYDKLEREISILRSSREADDIALDVQRSMNKEAHDAACKKIQTLEKLEADGDLLDDAEFLDELRGLFPECTYAGHLTTRKPSDGLSPPGSSGGDDAKQ